MTTNKHLARGIAIQDGKKVFVIGYYFTNGLAHYILSEKYDPTYRDDVNEGCFTEVISEPDQFIKTINGIDFFENDNCNIKDIYGTEFNGFFTRNKFNELIYKEASQGGEYHLSDFFKTGYEHEHTIESIGNTHGIAEGIKEGE